MPDRRECHKGHRKKGGKSKRRYKKNEEDWNAALLLVLMLLLTGGLAGWTIGRLSSKTPVASPEMECSMDYDALSDALDEALAPSVPAISQEAYDQLLEEKDQMAHGWAECKSDSQEFLLAARLQTARLCSIMVTILIAALFSFKLVFSANARTEMALQHKADEIDQLRSRLREKDAQASSDAAALKNLREELCQIRQEHAKIQETLRPQEEVQIERAKLAADRRKLKKDREKLEEERAREDRKLPTTFIPDPSEQLRQSCDSLRRKWKEATSEVCALKNSLTIAWNATREVRKERDALQEQKSAMKTHGESMVEKLNTYCMMLFVMVSWIGQCDRRLSTERAERREISTQLAAATRAASDLTRERDELRASCTGLRGQNAMLHRVQSRLLAQNEKVLELARQIKSKQEQMEGGEGPSGSGGGQS